MPHPVRKQYKSGSPGFLRKLADLTLTKIKKQIADSPNKPATRKAFRENGYLA